MGIQFEPGGYGQCGRKNPQGQYIEDIFPVTVTVEQQEKETAGKSQGVQARTQAEQVEKRRKKQGDGNAQKKYGQFFQHRQRLNQAEKKQVNESHQQGEIQTRLGRNKEKRFENAHPPQQKLKQKRNYNRRKENNLQQAGKIIEKIRTQIEIKQNRIKRDENGMKNGGNQPSGPIFIKDFS